LILIFFKPKPAAQVRHNKKSSINKGDVRAGGYFKKTLENNVYKSRKNNRRLVNLGAQGSWQIAKCQPLQTSYD
jgi:hypothetical protein